MFHAFVFKTSKFHVNFGHPRYITRSAKWTVSWCNAFSIKSSWSYSSNNYKTALSWRTCANTTMSACHRQLSIPPQLFTPTHHIFTNIDHKNYIHSLGEPGAASATRSNTPIVQNIEDLGHTQQHPAHCLEFSWRHAWRPSAIAHQLGNPQEHLAALEQHHAPNKEVTERLVAESGRELPTRIVRLVQPLVPTLATSALRDGMLMIWSFHENISR